MPYRSNAAVRRDINRLNELVARESGNEDALSAIADMVSSAAEKVNNGWNAYRDLAVEGDKERDERENAIAKLLDWIQRWRPVLMLKVPGASDNIRSLPASGATPDDVIRVAEDMVRFMDSNASAAEFREKAAQGLGSGLEDAKKETSDATAALPQESAARNAYTDACVEANTILVRGLEIVRAAYGRTSPEYKQFIARSSQDTDGDESEAETVGTAADL